VCVTGEQLAPDLLLEFCDVPADCRLTQSELLGCGGESSGVFDREEGSEQYRIEHHELLSQIAITNIAFICYCDNAVRRSVCSVKFLSRFYIDGFILAILAAVGVASVFPAAGAAADVLGWATKVAIGLLFLIYGARLSPSEAWQGVKHWRLHSVILAVTFVVFPLLGLALRILVPSVLSDELYTGILFLCLVPSTVQSSIAFTSIARGNVAGAVVSASFSNLVGVFVTPLLVILLMNTTGDAHVDFSSILDIVLQLLLPFFVGQLIRPFVIDWLQKYSEPTRIVDRGSIFLVVFSAFSASMTEGIWHTVTVWQVIGVVLVCFVILAVVLAVTAVAGRKLGFSVPDRIVIVFCGSKKSLATGLPMASVLFAGHPVGLIVLPLMIFHQIQLIVCAALAQKYSRRSREESASTVA
jgi:sodium/bile acid cotransporter 7